MSRSWQVILSLSLLSLCACAERIQENASLVYSKDCNVECVARVQETQILANAGGRAKRDNANLILNPANGQRLIMADQRAACDNGADGCESFVLMADLPRNHAFVVQNFYYEGSDIFLIDDRTGKQTMLNGMPTFSPDGTEFLVAPFSDETDVGDNNLEIWHRQGDAWVIEWAHPFKLAYEEDPNLNELYVTHVVRWDYNRIALSLFTEGNPFHPWAGTLTREVDGWHLSAKSPQTK
jgi:hypothetical protein